MIERRADAPSNVHSLTKRVDNLAISLDRPLARVQRAIANTVVAQMIPSGVVTGGSAMKLRLGDGASRFTPDLDAARAAEVELERYLEEMEELLSGGWGGFTGAVAELPAHAPADVPEDYVMRPFDVSLAYRGRHWLTVRLGLGHEEINAGELVEHRMADEIRDYFAILGLDEPQPVALLAAEPQAAEKLHACTYVSLKTGVNQRAHDLVDLQLLAQDCELDLAELGTLARRLFASRGNQPWPPTVIAYPLWSELYDKAAEGLAVLASVDEAVSWTNALILRAESAAAAQ